MATTARPPDDVPNDLEQEEPASESANNGSTANEINKPVTLLSQEQLDAEYKQTKAAFEVFIKQYQFPEGISRNGKKKMTKKLHMDHFKKIRRKIERQKLKRKRAANPETKRHRKARKLSHSCNSLRIAIDCSFDDLMSEKDIVMLTKQLQRCYAINRKMENPLQFHMTHLQDKTLARMEGFIDGYKNWDIHIKTESLVELFKPEDVVYLCAESENVLTEFDDKKVYVIGGFVDHNAHKGVAYERALTAGFQHARLPIDSYFTLATRKVLTVCQVFEMISYFVDSEDWEDAIKKTVPERKGLEAKDPTNNDNKIETNTDNDKTETSLVDNGNVDLDKDATVS